MFAHRPPRPSARLQFGTLKDAFPYNLKLNEYMKAYFFSNLVPEHLKKRKAESDRAMESFGHFIIHVSTLPMSLH